MPRTSPCRVGGQADIRKVTAASLIDEAAGWGIRRRAASAVVTETLDRVLAASAIRKPSGSAEANFPRPAAMSSMQPGSAGSSWKSPGQ